MALSKSQAGKGTVISIGNGASGTEVFTAVAEISSITQSGRQMGTDDTTNLGSDAREFITTILTPGSWDFTGNRVGSDAGQTAMETAFQAGTMHNFTIQLPANKADAQTTTGDKFAFFALVEELNYTPFAIDKKIQVTGKLKVSGAITITPGS